MKNIKLAAIITVVSFMFIGCTNTENSVNTTKEVSVATNNSSNENTISSNEDNNNVVNADNNASSNTDNSSSEIKSSENISVEEAKKIALQHAGLTEDEVSFLRAELDYDDSGIKKYEIEFYSNNTEYDYEINAANGEIISYDYDVENYNHNVSNNVSSQGSSANNTENYYEDDDDYIEDSTSQVGVNNVESCISVEEAKEIALQHAGLTEDKVSFLRTELDYDDDSGIKKYEIEFNDNNSEYDYEINAVTGNIISFDIEK